MGNKIYPPWIKTWYSIRSRCGNKKILYGNIKPLITQDELKHLWFRDKGWLLKEPTIDRIDTTGDYTFKNCRYIERLENIRRPRNRTELSMRSRFENLRKAWKAQPKAVVFRKEKQGEILGRFNSLTIAGVIMDRTEGTVCLALKNGWRCAGFYWDYLEAEK